MGGDGWKHAEGLLAADESGSDGERWVDGMDRIEG
jgi:hypothetical protein